MPEIEKYFCIIHTVNGEGSGGLFAHSNSYLAHVINKFTNDPNAYNMIISKEGYETKVKRKP
jgi:hypothetical protein